ncbi:MAG: hypothetical protein HIU91_01190 [Acidobacteria bacterium]|nr:hypothetical protein [Acidobacteriota bacterium]
MGLRLRRGGVGAGWLAGAALTVVGCASPGPPKAPTLHLPALVTDLTASRVGDAVTLHFTVPSQTTDKLAVRDGQLTGEFCREVEHQVCVAVPSSKVTVATQGANGARNEVHWADALPAPLDSGAPRLLGYRVEFFNALGRTAGWSAEAFTVAGAAPAKVEGLTVEGSRLGVVVAWQPEAVSESQGGEVLIERTDLKVTAAPAKAAAAKPAVKTRTKTEPMRVARKKPELALSRPGHAAEKAMVWMGTRQSGEGQPDRVLDTTAVPETPYDYSALRRVTVALGGHEMEMRSEPTAVVEFTLREVYPPRVPTGLRAVGYFENESATEGVPGKYAVDLVWEPVDEAGAVVPLAGYNVDRQRVDAAGAAEGARERLNVAPVREPSFHDATAQPGVSYKYSVTAVDAKGNESAADVVVLRE